MKLSKIIPMYERRLRRPLRPGERAAVLAARANCDGGKADARKAMNAAMKQALSDTTPVPN
jgi:hypothetical protein